MDEGRQKEQDAAHMLEHVSLGRSRRRPARGEAGEGGAQELDDWLGPRVEGRAVHQRGVDEEVQADGRLFSCALREVLAGQDLGQGQRKPRAHQAARKGGAAEAAGEEANGELRETVGMCATHQRVDQGLKVWVAQSVDHAGTGVHHRLRARGRELSEDRDRNDPRRFVIIVARAVTACAGVPDHEKKQRPQQVVLLGDARADGGVAAIHRRKQELRGEKSQRLHLVYRGAPL